MRFDVNPFSECQVDGFLEHDAVYLGGYQRIGFVLYLLMMEESDYSETSVCIKQTTAIHIQEGLITFTERLRALVWEGRGVKKVQ